LADQRFSFSGDWRRNAAGELRTVERRRKEDRAERPVFVREREEV
jgi:hypothetical protein